MELSLSGSCLLPILDLEIHLFPVTTYSHGTINQLIAAIVMALTGHIHARTVDSQRP